MGFGLATADAAGSGVNYTPERVYNSFGFA